jgi:hypothetical protein
MPQEVAININTGIWCSVSQKWEMAAFHAAIASLEPNTRVQTVTFTDKKILDGAKRLVAAGIFKAYGKSKNRFVIPKTVAFATFEDAVFAA